MLSEAQESRDLFTAIDGGSPDSIAASFAEFHAENPTVYVLFQQFAFDAIRAGRHKIGAKMIMERVRWDVLMATKSSDGFKVNNNFTAFYARRFMRDYPEYDGIFETRKSVADA